jgi:peptidoglycan/LPS O-acetylase OafA/YrhL
MRLSNLHDPETSLLANPESSSPLTPSRRIPELDGLRGVAIGLVLCFHYFTISTASPSSHLLTYLHASTRLFWSGVDLFFVLSGFLIGGNLLDARNSPAYFKTFYIRRVCRILPVYFLLLGVIGTAYLFVYRPIGASLDWIFAGHLPWYAYFSFAQNLWMAKWNTPGSLILVVTWSLAVEEQFYLVLPFLIRLVRRTALPYVYLAGIVIAPVVRIFLALRFPLHLVSTYVLLPCRMDALFLGALCAYGLREPGIWSWFVKRRGTVWIAFFILLAGLPVLNASLGSTWVPSSLLMVSVGYGWIAALYSSVLILALTDSRSSLGRAMRWPWLASLGAISYSVYLFHLGIYFFCLWLLTGHGWFLANWKDF